MANDLWRTPPEVFDYFNSIYNFEWDLAASDQNFLCRKYLTVEEDYLCGGIACSEYTVGRYSWLNPPYSNPLPFVRQAIADSQLCGVGIVILLNHDMSTKWANLLCSIECKHIVFTSKRISFLNSEDVPVKGNSKGQFVAVIPPYVREGVPLVKYVDLNEVMTGTLMEVA